MNRRLLVPLFWLAALILLIGLACTALTGQPTDTPEPLSGGPTPSPTQTVELLPTYTPPPGTTSYYGCAFKVNVPPELTTDDDSWYVTFIPTSGEPGYVSIYAWKMPGIDIETAFAQVIDQRDLKNPTPQAVTVLDDWGAPLTGLQSDFTKGENHYRVLVFVRPDTMLGDMAPTEVVYEIVAKAPENDWDTWEPIFEVILKSLQPASCMGI